MSLNDDSIIKYFLGIWDDEDELSTKTWVYDVFYLDLEEDRAKLLHENVRSVFSEEYERYLSWMEDNLCRSRVNFEAYYGLLQMEALETDDYSALKVFDMEFTDEDFKELEVKAVDYLEENGEKSLLEPGVYGLGHRLTAFLYFLFFSIDRVSQQIVSLLLSNNRIIEEKIEIVKRRYMLKCALERALGTYCSEWQSQREYYTALEFALGFFKGRFHFSGDVVDMCAEKTALSRYCDSLFSFFLTFNDNNLSDSLLNEAYQLKEETDKRIREYKQIENNLNGGSFRIENIDGNSIETYIPCSAEEREETLYSICSRDVSEYYWCFMELQGQLPSVDLMLNVLRKFDDSSSVNYTNEEIDDLYDELEFNRNEIIRLVYANARRAKEYSSNISVEQIEIREHHLLACWEMLDMLEETIESTSIENVDKFMKLKKKIVEKAMSLEEGTLLQYRMAHIINLMKQRIDELSRGDQESEKVYKVIYDNLEGIDDVNKDFITTLSGGEKLYSLFIEKNEVNAEFDYSCISIMYYTALETLLTKYLYVDYLKKKGLMENGRTQYLLIDDANEKNARFFGRGVKLKTIKNRRGRVIKGQFPEYAELGTFKYIYNQTTINNSRDLQEYLNNDLGIQDTTELVDYCEEVYELRIGRNRAAHGMHIVTAEETKKAKKDTFTEEIDNLNGLIIDFLRMINPSINYN